MEICKICNGEFKSIQSLAKHIKGTHKISSEEYYLRYVGSEGVCVCGAVTKYRNLAIGYTKHCSSKCAYHNSDVVAKREATLIDKYGTSQVGSSDIIQEKIRNTIFNKYGVTHVMKNKEIKNKVLDSVYAKYGVTSVLKLDAIKDKIKQTNINKYGTEYPMQNIEVMKKASDTCMKNNGVLYPSQSDTILNKQKLTNITRYGYTSATKSQVVKDKIYNTNLNKYGYKSPLSNNEVKHKSEITCLNKYGVVHPGLIKEAHKKKLNTCESRYGNKYLFKIDSIKEKSRMSILAKYGVDNPNKSTEIQEKIYNTVKKRVFDSNYSEFSKYNCVLLDYDTRVFSYKCNVCGAINNESYDFVKVCRFNKEITPCITCSPKQARVSFMEHELLQYIKSQYEGIVIDSDTSEIAPKELDIYLPELQLAFEFNGLFYHSEIYKDRDYHINKTNACNKKGIHLIHVYEDDWLYKAAIVKSRICNLLGKSTVIYARKCIIKSVDSGIANKFLNANHIQGSCGSSHKYGLYYNNELVSLMTFGKSRFSDDMELIRFCNKLNTTVVGGASKLFSYFIRNIQVDKIISYADRSWSNGHLYESIGFSFDSVTKPNYYYVNGDIRENRMKYQKHKLIKDGFDSNKTEHEIMLDRKIYRIYDSGNLKYIWNR